MIKGLFSAILAASGNLSLIILYGKGNFDSGEENKKAMGFSLLNTFWLLFFIMLPVSSNALEFIAAFLLLASYPVILTVCGIYNRKHHKTSYTVLGKLKLAKQYSQEEKDDYLENKASKSVIAFCEEHKGNDKEVYFHILKAYQDGKLNKAKAEVIWEKYKTK